MVYVTAGYKPSECSILFVDVPQMSGQAPAGATFAPLNAGITSFANRSSCSRNGHTVMVGNVATKRDHTDPHVSSQRLDHGATCGHFSTAPRTA